MAGGEQRRVGGAEGERVCLWDSGMRMREAEPRELER